MAAGNTAEAAAAPATAGVVAAATVPAATAPAVATLWQWLEGKGVLLEPLYRDLWRDCGLTGGAQALFDLLEHFDLARKINKARMQEGPD